MNRHNWLRKLFGPRPASRRKRQGIALQVEVLELRCVPTLATLAAFNGVNGIGPIGGLVADSSGNLFGTTVGGGGSGNDGTVFEVPKGSAALTTLAIFNGSNGEKPQAGVILDGSGNLFGTTSAGGTSNDGTIFELPKGSSAITTRATFNGTNGSNSSTALVQDSSGNLFGLTAYGGVGYSGTNSSGDGTVFELPSGSSSITTIAQFRGANGVGPSGHLALDASGNLFGATDEGGAAGDGTVFEVPKGSGTITTLASFNTTNGAYTLSGVVLDSSGNLFGTTLQGGMFGDGTVFEVQKGSGLVTTLATFNGSNGSAPYSNSGVVLDSSGNLFGTASTGGGSNDGTVFEVARGSGAITTVAPFSGTNGADPQAGLLLDNTGNLFGTTFGAGASNGGTVFEASPSLTITTASLPGWTLNEPGYNQTLSASGGTKAYHFLVTTGTLPTGLTLSSSGLLSGTPTVQGTYSFTVTATDATGITASQNYLIVIGPGPFSQYLVTVLGASTVQAGSPVQVTVQAADAYGNPVAGYPGPSSVTPGINPASSASSMPAAVALNSSGFGFFLVSLQQVGSYTITVSAGAFTGSTSTPVTVTPGPAVKLGFGAQPVSTPTGVTLPPVMVQILDFYGNVVTSDNTDMVTLGIASGPPGAPGFTAASTTTALVQNGIATFNNLTLVYPGNYTLSELVHAQYIGPDSTSFTVLPLQVVPGSLAGTPSGFSLSFNAPLLVNSTTPVLYGPGFGATAPVPSITLTQTLDGTGQPVSNPIQGSLVLNGTTNTLTFVATNTVLEANNGSPVLPDGTYTVVLHSSAANNGFQALNRGGGFLDGLGSGTPGSGDYTGTFAINAAALHDDLVWVPAVAEGPGQALNAPGMNQAGGGYPLYLSDSTGLVTNVHVTLNYDPALLSVTGVTGASFTLLGSSTPGQALLQYSGPALPTGNQVPIGFVSASVPPGTSAAPIAYKATDLLHLSGVTLNAGAIRAASGDALHLVAYVGDADGDGAYSSADAALITRVALQTDSGFTAYPLVDPVIVADTDGSGFIPADAALQVNEAGVGFPTTNLANPPVPAGVMFQVASSVGAPPPSRLPPRQPAADPLFQAQARTPANGGQLLPSQLPPLPAADSVDSLDGKETGGTFGEQVARNPLTQRRRYSRSR